MSSGKNVIFFTSAVVSAVLAVVGLIQDEIVFVLASMIVAPVLSAISLFPTNLVPRSGQTVLDDYFKSSPVPRSLEYYFRPLKYYFRSLENNIKKLKFIVVIVIIVLTSLFVGYIASAFDFTDLSNYLAMNPQGELVRENLPPSQLASRIDLSNSAYFAGIIATCSGGILLTVIDRYGNRIAEQVVGIAIAASFAPPASALGLVLTLDNRWNLAAPVFLFLLGNAAALFTGIHAVRLIYHTKEREVQQLKIDITGFFSFLIACTFISKMFLIFVT